ncbi:hypothetical protein EDF52_10276 [Curtobacterium sp. PhB42]|uniref:hypothetical protein n=1 Tax=unclassified Curtobacterium TaxID=257496 RepID=UPI001062CA5D|nr:MULTISPECIES: hypothetical protein [unclassified Curtobacterium]TDW50988.1 hypothetical protein EDF52_10276 [Curtobacterium sp. PhB42]TDW56166.1 hypothetical protein EDF47_104277 [Curtobacterium sp. PhB190]
MAILSKAYEVLVEERLGYIPEALSAIVSPLSAAQRDRFTLAWVNASDEQREQPADQWVLLVEDRDAFEKFRIGINQAVAVP